ncbi:hypothetical protein CTEN210_11605 [Chaetoceros tenuissimus]|uniref:Uncharacterized protein n=1 Tax=Chaetoceros tenuissimus TaxID=426638 RepID=A0AAD3H9P8_9STRA|nr:hypothetical protein CTEN210_11605 [Chaetoceros tenuissimus]
MLFPRVLKKKNRVFYLNFSEFDLDRNTFQYGFSDCAHKVLKGVEVENGTGFRYDESGTSITVLRKHLYITGVTQKSLAGICTDPIFRDILLFRIDPDGNVVFMKHYDHDGMEDVGLAITPRVKRVKPTLTAFPPIPTRPRADLFIAGVTKSKKFNADVENDDVFLLTTNFVGKVKSFEIFGGAYDDGGSFPENIDLEITQDSNVLIQANTKSFTSPNQYTFLIERYDSILKQCYDLSVKPSVNKYLFPVLEASDKSIDATPKEDKMKAVDVTMSKKILCEKKQIAVSTEKKKKEWEH